MTQDIIYIFKTWRNYNSIDPEKTISGIPAILVDIIGSPARIASKIEIGNPSSLLGNIKISLLNK